jgi:hypothetical protein
VRDLFRWCLTSGQPIASEMGYVRLPSAVAVRALAALDGITATR